jgi:hypothetical protein
MNSLEYISSGMIALSAAILLLIIYVLWRDT